MRWTRAGGTWYFGWNIVAVATVLTLLSVGLRLSIGPFFFPIAHDLGFSRSGLSSIIAVGMLVYGVMMPLAGWLVARISTRGVLLAGTLMVVVGTVWTVNAHTALDFLLAFGVVLSIGLALVSPVTLTPIVSRWFVRQRGMALFFLSTGGMAGLAVVTPVLTWAIEAFGWRHAMVGYVALFALLALPSVVYLIREDVPPGADLRVEGSTAAPAPAPEPALGHLGLWQALATRPFWLITLGLFANGFSMTLLGAHGVPMLVDHHFSPTTGGLGIGMIGMVAIFSTLVLGHVADRVSRRKMLAMIYFVRGAAFIGLLLVATPGQLYAVAIVGGLVWAGSLALSSAIMADVYGVRTLGVLYGIAYLCQQIAGMVSAWLGGWGYETFQTHWVAFGAAALVLFVGGAVTLALPHHRMRVPAAAVRGNWAD
ncbi:MAG: MFS transporter [Burkholderiales bacterium]|nr:MFS transporter [Burkholderiales bacterium]